MKQILTFNHSTSVWYINQKWTAKISSFMDDKLSNSCKMSQHFYRNNSSKSNGIHHILWLYEMQNLIIYRKLWRVFQLIVRNFLENRHFSNLNWFLRFWYCSLILNQTVLNNVIGLNYDFLLSNRCLVVTFAISFFCNDSFYKGRKDKLDRIFVCWC